MNKQLLRNTFAARLARKSRQSDSSFKIAAVALDRRGDVLGYAVNARNMLLPSRRGAGIHAEMRLMRRYKENIDVIYIFRTGRAGAELPIDPCGNCAKAAEKLGIRIVPLRPEEQETEPRDTGKRTGGMK